MIKKSKKDNAFLIKYSKQDSIAKVLWIEALLSIIELEPKFKVEGLNYRKRNAKEEKLPQLEIRNGNDYVEFGEYVKTTRDVIGVGVSSEYNVSFETLKNFRLSSYLPIYSLPVFDLNKDYEKILNKLYQYLEEVFPVKTKKKQQKDCVEVEYHSNFIRVGTSRIDYDDEKEVKKLLKGRKQKKEKVNSVRYVLAGVTIV